MQADRLLFVDGLRGIAALAVVFYHLVGRTDIGWLSAYGYLGVATFFVLSGYVITMVVGTNKITLGFLGRFAARRSLRLDPPYWLSIAIIIALMSVARRIGVDKDLPGLSTLLVHLLYLQDLLGVPALSSVYWTLCLEIQFYLVLILLLASPWPTMLVCVLLGWSLLEHSNLISIAPRGLFVHYWFGFAAGALTYWTMEGRLRSRYLYVALAVILIFSFGRNGAWCFTTVMTAGALCMASRLGRMGIWLSGGTMQGLGRISYSLYLFHPIIGWSAQSFALRHVNQWGALFVGLVASLLSAWIAYLLVEKPSIRLSHWVSLRPAPGADGHPGERKQATTPAPN
jgi:peptidoglycan/LPS O-acetylase OafA/YrhL